MQEAANYMDNRNDLLKLDDDEVYLILYLWKVKGLKAKDLAHQFRVSDDSLNDLLLGHVRKDCYKGFHQIEKYLVETT